MYFPLTLSVVTRIASLYIRERPSTYPYHSVNCSRERVLTLSRQCEPEASKTPGVVVRPGPRFISPSSYPNHSVRFQVRLTLQVGSDMHVLKTFGLIDEPLPCFCCTTRNTSPYFCVMQPTRQCAERSRLQSMEGSSARPSLAHIGGMDATTVSETGHPCSMATGRGHQSSCQ